MQLLQHTLQRQTHHLNLPANRTSHKRTISAWNIGSNAHFPTCRSRKIDESERVSGVKWKTRMRQDLKQRTHSYMRFITVKRWCIAREELSVHWWIVRVMKIQQNSDIFEKIMYFKLNDFMIQKAVSQQLIENNIRFTDWKKVGDGSLAKYYKSKNAPFFYKKKKHFSLEVTRKRCTISIQYFWVKKRFYNWFFWHYFHYFLKSCFFYWLYCPMSFDQFWTLAEVRVKKNGRPLLFLLIPQKIVS